ncbi:MAG: type 1 fimbrial protein [Variovorax sp.]|nr:type 1 fimbrial protein [Variovorax sp.]
MINWIKNAGSLLPKRWSLAFCLLAAAGGASAQTCSFKNDSIAQTLTAPLTSASITAGRDLPVGSVLSHQIWTQFANAGIECDSGSMQLTIAMENIGLALSAWQPSGAMAGKMYQTNLPGVGVTFRTNSTPSTYIPETWTWTIGGDVNTGARLMFGLVQVQFWKIGDITPGTISTVGFPTITMSVGTAPKMRLWTFNIMGGSLNIVSQTCTTSDQLVPLGDRPQTDFTGIGTGSPLRDFAIELKNCPAFFGSNRRDTQTYEKLDGIPTNALVSTEYGAFSSNTIRFQLTPPAANIQSPGILKLGAPIGGGTNATGVGIEIRQRSAAVPIAFNTWLDGLDVVNVDANSTQTIPLSARLVQTAAQVTPGQANGSVEFLLDYQ